MSKCYIVNEPLRRNEAGEWESFMSIASNVREYGEAVFLLPAGPIANEPQATVDALAKAMEDFTESDWLVPVGHPFAVGVATAMAASITGRLRMLCWHNSKHLYIPMDGTIFVSEDA